MSKKTAVFRNIGFSKLFFLTDDRTDLGIGSYERSWPEDVPFDSFGQIWPPEMALKTQAPILADHCAPSLRLTNHKLFIFQCLGEVSRIRK